MMLETLCLKPWRDHAGRLGHLPALLEELAAHQQLVSPEPEFLFSLSWEARADGAVVEIGTSVGTSLLALAAAQKLGGTGRAVTTIDRLRHCELDRNIDRAGVRAQVNAVVAKSADVALQWSDPIELLWIDADHSRAGCLSDIRHWAPHVIPGGLIALHDYADGMGVHAAVLESLLAEPWHYRVVADRTHGNIFVVEKIAAEGSVAPWRDAMAPVDPYPTARPAAPASPTAPARPEVAAGSAGTAMLSRLARRLRPGWR